MDHLVYTAATGAKQLLLKQETIAHNLANANTPGFRADLEASRAVPLQGDPGMSRVFAVESTPTSNFASGPMQATGRNLDIAVEGEGWIAVESLDGSEAYTRAGALDVLPALAAMKPGRLVYVSCHPGSLARDLGILVSDHGFSLQAAGIVDMFPHTSHVESVAVLDGPGVKRR